MKISAVSIPSQSERRERDLQELFRKAKRPVALFVDDAHDLHPETLTALKRLVELVTEGGGQLAVILVGHPKLRNDLKRPLMEEIGNRTTVFEFGGPVRRQAGGNPPTAKGRTRSGRARELTDDIRAAGLPL